MSTAGSSGTVWIAIIGDRTVGFDAQDAIEPSIRHSANALAVDPPPTLWIGTDALAASGPELLAGAVAVWCAPGSPYVSLAGALSGIRWARERDVPFLGTCAGFQHAVVEFARNVLGHGSAAHPEYGDAAASDLLLGELSCALDGQMSVQVVDEWLRDVYGTSTATERYYCRFGLNPAWRAPLHDAGLRVAATDAADGDARILRLVGHSFFVLTLFVPQTSSTPTAPHPLVTGYLRAALG